MPGGDGDVYLLTYTYYHKDKGEAHTASPTKEMYDFNIITLPAATHCFQYHLLSLQSRGMTLLAGYFLHVSSAPHQKHLMSSTQSPQDVFLCEQVKAGVVVDATVVPVLLLFVVTGAAVALGDELFKLVEEGGIVVVVVELFADMLRNKQIQRKTETPIFLMVIGLRSQLIGNGKMKKKAFQTKFLSNCWEISIFKVKLGKRCEMNYLCAETGTIKSVFTFLSSRDLA